MHSTDSERKSASPACYLAILLNARKSVGNNGVFSLSFGPFLSLFIAKKEKEKDKDKVEEKFEKFIEPQETPKANAYSLGGLKLIEE